MKKGLFTFLLLIVLPAMASHIVGGEFELIHISGNEYRLNMILYFDLRNGNPDAKDQQVIATIYRKSDKSFMRDVTLPLISENPVGYTQPQCSTGEIKTNKLVYSTSITLSDALYNDPQGYFVVWQRCCRNYTITNILSEPPLPDGSVNPNSAGQTFYLEFPPVVKNGQPFINSSPRLFPPLNDFACPYRPYYVDFSGTDDDGDSLVYSMVTPWSTVTNVALPPESPGPYPLVQWQQGFSLTNILHGAPDLRITTDGLLTCTPTVQGLFVFAVQVLQYRNGQVIGLSRRDFQMLVVDGCQPAQAPQIVGISPTGTFRHAMTVDFPYTTPDTARCVKVRVSDPDSQLPSFKFTQNVTIRAVALNFNKKNLTSILPVVKTATLLNGSTADFSICFPSCPFVNGPMEIGIIAFDQTCSLPLTDTLRLTVTIHAPPNTPPYFTTPTPVNQILAEGQQGSWPFTAKDDENDSLVVYMITDGFVLKDAGMTFNVDTNHKGLASGRLGWDAFCNIYDFTKRTGFQVQVIVDDLDLCQMDQPTKATYNLSVLLPGISDPVISVNPAALTLPGVERKVFESLSFDVLASQAEGDFLKLKEDGPGTLVKSAAFAPAAGNGSLSSHFQWNIDCNTVDLKKQSSFTFQFVVLDTANWCRFIKTDTVAVSVKVLPPDNIAPTLVLQDQNSVAVPNGELNVVLGTPISLFLIGNDLDLTPHKDSLTLRMVGATGSVDPAGYSFTTAKGLGNVVAPFTWQPGCEIFKGGVYDNDYTFSFKVADNRCFNIKDDTVTLHLNIHDISNTGRKFLPGNIVTPNGDGCNDYFAVEGIDASNPDCFVAVPDDVVSLPLDNCAGHFQFVHIHNRWGKSVFESTHRNFRWYPTPEMSGEYYYLIKFSNSDYKGILTVR